MLYGYPADPLAQDLKQWWRGARRQFVRLRGWFLWHFWYKRCARLAVEFYDQSAARRTSGN